MNPSPRFLLWPRILFPVWILCWVPVVLWAYGPQNFFWLCNLANFVILGAVLLRSSLLASSQLGTVLVIGFCWTADLLASLPFGRSLTGFTDYMFDPEIPLLARGISLYHIGLPVFVFWFCRKVGYDRRGLWIQCGIGTASILGAWKLTDPVRNINWIRAPLGIEQVWIPEPLFVSFLILAYPLLLFVPGHYVSLFLLRWFPPAQQMKP